MKTCPHCGGSLHSARQELPKKLSKTHEKIIAFCRVARTSKEIADFLGTTMSGIYHHLRLLQRLDQLEKIQDPHAGGHNHGCTFKATGKQIAFDPAWMRYTTSVMGVRL